jgi:urease accessory protein UreF
VPRAFDTNTIIAVCYTVASICSLVMNEHVVFTSDKTSNWLLYLLTDSALPTGGFVASSGLEASFQAGLIASASALPEFTLSAAHSFAYNTIPFVRAGYYSVDSQDPIKELQEVDVTCEALMVGNTVARRASLAQGVAMLTLHIKCFAPDDDLVKEWKKLIRAEKVDGHFAVCFGLVCRRLNVSIGQIQITDLAHDTVSNHLYFFRKHITFMALFVYANIIFICCSNEYHWTV